MFENIKAVAMDVDGVLTDGTVWWGTNGEEYKRFSYADISGIPLAQKAGLKIALISGESNPVSMTLVQRFADKLKITDVYKGCHDKAAAVQNFASKYQINLCDVCFIGDDIPDLPAMSIVGVPVAPANAQTVAKTKAKLVTSRNGGFGVAREIIELILHEKKISI